MEYAAHDLQQAPGVRLTARQLEVLALLCEGMANKLICRRLNIAAGTVKAHITVILRALGVSSRLQAVVAAQRCGLLRGPAVNTPALSSGSGPAAQPAIAAAASDRRTSHRFALAA